MLWFLYWIGIFILTLALCFLIKISNIEEDELPLPKEAILRALTFLTVIGSIFLLVSQSFIRCKEIYEEQNKTFFFKQN
jgi:hypothetical protein